MTSPNQDHSRDHPHLTSLDPTSAPTCGVYGHRHTPPLKLDTEQLIEAARMFYALSDPQRLLLLLDLAEGERCVSELVHSRATALSTVTDRLQTLFDARLVKRRRDDVHIYYSLADDHVLVLLRNMLAHSAEPF
jgi:ArsR family transcriptional regulator